MAGRQNPSSGCARLGDSDGAQSALNQRNNQRIISGIVLNPR